jgi:hypothetical protein
LRNENALYYIKIGYSETEQVLKNKNDIYVREKDIDKGVLVREKVALSLSIKKVVPPLFQNVR